MTTTTELLISESENENNIIYAPIINCELVNLNYFLQKSFNDYSLYITQHSLKLTRKDKNKLGIHFILKQLLQIVSVSKYKKHFYYKVNDSIENILVKRIFAALPTRIQYGDIDFNTFVNEHEYYVFRSIDSSLVSFSKFRQFLKRYELQSLEKEFLNNVNVKLSLLP